MILNVPVQDSSFIEEKSKTVTFAKAERVSGGDDGDFYVSSSTNVHKRPKYLK